MDPATQIGGTQAPAGAVVRGAGFVHQVDLPGWSARSSWGYDPVYEGYWLRVWDVDHAARPAVEVAPSQLISTVAGLARVMARALDIDDGTAFLALTA
ncbi:hypothetical protein [Actinotalea sp. K2]|uniref:hypothetical protein n=1 Tax=Actinotalea sp. K2 TaxID=2939438 RepID=UPI0020181C55|nr:hypothetical protein [Actinotalea sp. K2]MCL3862244.1 hypothetical protein [Actinotalea sp. K2]